MRATLSFLILVAYPLWVHLSVSIGHPMWGATALPVFYLAQRLLAVGGLRLGAVDWSVLAVLGAAVAVGLAYGRHTLIYMPPVAITAMIFLTFARSLVGEGPALATRFARAMGETTPEVERYTHRLTWVWTILLGAIVVETVLLPFLVSDEVWSLFCNVLNYVFIGAFMSAEFVYRKIRFRRPYTLAGFIRRMASVDFRNI
ncbi:hypothetical protein H0Z60_11760 [Ectothiorhodospiraceae bacterium WFHF3C12]|nr:hypothetical protein [Ectothiorhodospiraceae bacterium WFHF3C12]